MVAVCAAHCDADTVAYTRIIPAREHDDGIAASPTTRAQRSAMMRWPSSSMTIDVSIQLKNAHAPPNQADSIDRSIVRTTHPTHRQAEALKLG